MTIEVISDLHGNLIDLQPFDLLLICGDICPTTNHSISYQEYWLKNTFNDWLKQLPYKDIFSRIICVAGNHDFYFERLGEIKRKDLLSSLPSNFVYLENELYLFEYQTIEGSLEYINIFGTPYCKIFGNWAFMKTEDTLREYYSNIPEGIDILISHDAPKDYNGLGCITEGHPAYHKDVGNTVLAEAVNRVTPRYYFCGHIHSGNHSFNYDSKTWNANVSVCNEAYDPINEPLVFEYKTKEDE